MIVMKLNLLFYVVFISADFVSLWVIQHSSLHKPGGDAESFGRPRDETSADN